MIANQAASDPEQIALASNSEQLTYRELDLQARRLADHLRSLGAGPEILIAIALDRSPQFVVAALAVLQSGAAYLPMDLTHPAERLRFIIKDARVSLLITEGEYANSFADLDLRIIALDAEKEIIALRSAESPSAKPEPETLAYVIYTSGSTGEPKGVEITQRNLSNLIAWHTRAFALDSSARGTFQASVAFDAAVWEMWPLLTAGGTLYLPDDFTRISPAALRDWLIEHQITISFAPTAVAEELISLRWPNETPLRFLLTGGDTLHRYPPAGMPFSLINNYGPTECTVVATSGLVQVDRPHPCLPSIGSPIDGVRVRILDERLREVPNGAPGEIYLGGDCVGRGYRNRRDLTNQRFMADPFGNKGDRLYRTGDLGRMLPNGEIAFLGRLDDQVKIRGNRVELNEINAVLCEHPSVKTSVVIMREDFPGDRRLVAYIVPSTDSQPNDGTLRRVIRHRLPDYMEPSAFVWMDSLPLTSNGKVDRETLPMPSVQEREFVGPRTPVEEVLAGVIREVLKLDRVSVHDDFFHLGAHSLLGAQIVARVRERFGAELKLLDVFDAPTVAELASRIEQTLTGQLNAMTEAEVDAAFATLNGAAADRTDSR